MLFRMPRGVARIAIFGFVACLIIILMVYSARKNEQRVAREFRWLDELKRRTSNDASGCSVQILDPWDAPMRQLHANASPIVCTPVQKRQVVRLEKGRLFFNKKYATNFTCQLRTIYWNGDSSYSEGNWSTLPAEKDGVPMPDDFVQVRCSKRTVIAWSLLFWDSDVVFDRIFASAVPKKTFNAKTRPVLDASPQHPRVVMLGLDSMSRSNFYRHMPRTLEALRKRSAVEFPHHVKMGDNTYPNWMAILTGRHARNQSDFSEELPERQDTILDGFPFIWKDFAKNGYATLFGEDFPLINTFTFARKHGLLQIPTDHYMRPFYLALEDSDVSRRSSEHCYDDTPRPQLMLDYTESFLTAYPDKRLFAWVWGQEVTHDFLNSAGKLDDAYARFISSPLFDDPNTILIVFSDHGQRIDKIRRTHIGRLESRLPFLSIVVPLSVRMKYPEVLARAQKNADLLSTPFDLHRTLLDIAEGEWLQTYDVVDTKSTWHGYSNFARKPENRTCFAAHISSEYCPCFTEVALDTKDSQKPVAEVLAWLNDLLTPGNVRRASGITPGYECSSLALRSVQFASVRIPPKILLDPKSGVGELYERPQLEDMKLVYRVGFGVEAPSGAYLEAEIEHNIRDDVWTVLGDVERNNRYGNTSHCVTDPLLKKLCHCLEIRP